jgi:hypothetical protein
MVNSWSVVTMHWYSNYENQKSIQQGIIALTYTKVIRTKFLSSSLASSHVVAYVSSKTFLRTVSNISQRFISIFKNV